MERIDLNKKVFTENDRLAAELRRTFEKHNLLVLNMVSSPGSGKTSLLEQTIKNGGLRMALIVGDIQTDNDAVRLQNAGAEIVRPIETGGACHLDASMIGRAISNIDLSQLDLLIIENVGNLVCPSSYDLGEDMKVVLISTTEGDDKPLKYPGMFMRSDVMVINKTDLLEFCDFSIEAVRNNARSINHSIEIIELSCRTGDGLSDWYKWLAGRVEKKAAAVSEG